MKLKAVKTVYVAEKAFIEELFQKLPKGLGCNTSSNDDEYIIDSDEDNNSKVKSKKAKFEESLKQVQKNRTFDRSELQRRLHAKISELSDRNAETEKSARKKASKTQKKDEVKKLKLISQSHSQMNNQNQQKDSAPKSAGGAGEEKTPLQKKPVKKTNGEIVYSKFDFISDDKKPQEFHINKNATSATKMLKVVKKKQDLVESLKAEGKTSEAVFVAEKQKWNNALQRAKGTKVKDDPDLLKKTIKREEKIKKAKQKKWKERVDQQEKFKEQRQTKRETNLQKRKDDKQKKFKKVQRKKGRIA